MRFRTTTAAGLTLTAALLGLTAPSTSATPAPGSTGGFEQQLTDDPSYAQGEPSIAVNPRNPNNIILTFLVNVGFGFYGAEQGQPPTGARVREQAMQGCDAFVSFDAGRHWKRQTVPVASFTIDPTRPNCSDTLVLFDKNGVAYVIGSSFQFPTFAVGQGDFRLISSRDGGRTWTRPSVVSPTFLSPGGNPAADGGARFYDDREFMALDRSTGTLYVNGTQGRAATDAQGNIEYLVSSTDGGRTWGNAIAVGNASAVQLGAAFGTVAFTSAAPQGAQRECACHDVVVSTDGAKTYQRYPTLIPRAAGTPVLGGGGAPIVADPTRRGRFVLVNVEDGRMVVYRSTDGAHRWNKAGSLGVPGRGVSKMWLDWTPQGVLGVGWRATTDAGYGFYGAVSYDAGSTWTVKRISKVDSPEPQGVWVGGDDTSAIAITKDRFYGTWGDWRDGSLQTYWGGFPLPKRR